MNDLWGNRWIRVIVAMLVFTVLLWLVYVARAVLFPFAVAFALAYLLDPLIDRIEKFHVRRSIAIMGLLGLVLSLCLGMFAIIVPMAIEQADALTKNLPGYIKSIEREIEPFLDSIPAMDSEEMKQRAREAISSFGDLPARVAKAAAGALWSALTGAMGYFIAMINLVIIPVATFYLLKDFDHIMEKAASRVPQRNRAKVFELARKIDAVLAGFFRGQLMVALFMAVFLSIGLLILGVPAGLFIGLVAGFANIVPYLAVFVGLAPAVALAYVKFGTFGSVLSVAILFAVANAVEGFVITPRLFEKEVGLHPVVVMAALLAGGAFFGFLGLVLAVPAAAVIKVGLGELDEAYMKSDFYLDGDKDSGPSD